MHLRSHPPASGNSLAILGSAGAYTLYVQSSAVAGKSLGMHILAGTNSSDEALVVANTTGTSNFFIIYGDGGIAIGPGIVSPGASNVNANGYVGVYGATPTVTAGRTDIGITTTGTVITTAGGISLPALAKTFWVVNVNGVAYGVPCFAL